MMIVHAVVKFGHDSREMRLTTVLPIVASLLATANGPPLRENKTQRSSAQVFVTPYEGQYFTPASVDHIVVMGASQASGRDRGIETKVLVTRSGPWLREETPGRIVFANIDTGMPYAVERSPEGRNRTISMMGPKRSNKLTIERTGKIQRILGERCTIWLFTHENSYFERNCITDDGIMLSRSAETKDGFVLASAHALSITRRRVAPSEVEPSADLFALASWPAWTLPIKGGPNDEVLLESADASGNGTARSSLLIRRLGPYLMTDERSSQNHRRIYERGDFRINVIDRLDGTLDWFGASPIGPGERKSLLDLVNPVPTGKTDTILGRACRYFDMAPNVSDFSQVECRTDDGLVLRRATSSWGSNQTVTAIKVTIGRLALREVAPPVTVFSAYR
jgi:hypothetical protein